MRNTQNLKKSSSCFDKSANLLSKCQKHEEEFFSNYVCFSKSPKFKNPPSRIALTFLIHIISVGGVIWNKEKNSVRRWHSEFVKLLLFFRVTSFQRKFYWSNQIFYQTDKSTFLFFKGEGYLTIETLSSILLELEPSLGKDELQDIIDEVDEDGSGTIDFDGKNNGACIIDII